MTQPGVVDGEPADTAVMLKAIQVLQKMLEIVPEENILDQECISRIVNLVKFPDRKIQEEVGNLMILLSDKIDDPSSLLEIQKFNLSKIENGVEAGD
jgi:hypothetical protein